MVQYALLRWFLSWKKKDQSEQNETTSSYKDTSQNLKNANSAGSIKSSTIKIITDEPTLDDALDFKNYSQNLADIIKNTTPRFSIGIFGGWGTGKTSLMKMIKDILDENKKLVTVWFDAWRYEKEDYLAVIPFLRTVKLTLDYAEKSKIGNWKDVKNGVVRGAITFLKSTKVTYGIKDVISIETDFGKVFSESLKGDGSVGNDINTIYYHATGFLEKALNELREKDKDYRIVVFIDDLDRCRPEKALEVLESIKSFFDIEGIVYVIGMDSQSINPLVKRKYGKDSPIEGLDYSQKIVQLPFQIPTWKEIDISRSINKIISKGLEGSHLVKEFEKNNKLIVKAVELNPREVKRFINNIILAESVFKKPIDELIVVQALRFRPEWNSFLESITPDDEERKAFLNEYKRLKEKIKTANKHNEINKEISEARDDFPLFKDILDPDAFMRGDALTSFLDIGGLEVLLNIEKMEEYRRALATIEHKPIEEASFAYFVNIYEEKVKEYNKLNAFTSGGSCDDSLWNHVIGKERRKVIGSCITVSGVIGSVKVQRDRSYSIRLSPDPQFVNLITPANTNYSNGDLRLRVYRPNPVSQSETSSSYICSICGKNHKDITIPPVGTHVSVTGSYVLDLGHRGWAEINPVSSISAIS